MLEVRRSTKGPQIFVSRTHKGFLKRLFELEVPEIHNGTVEIKAIAREAGSRSKVAVSSRQDGLDPVGATVGQRGARVQAVVAELSGEKIDVIPWSDDASVFVANALSPAQVISVDIDEEHRIASVTVPERMLSLAIGREGQNARLAARLTGWRIDIRSDVSVAEAKAAADAATDEAAAVVGGRRAEPPRRQAKRVTKKAASRGGRAPRATPLPPKRRPPPTRRRRSDAVAKPKRATKAKAADAAKAATPKPTAAKATTAAKAKAPSRRRPRPPRTAMRRPPRRSRPPPRSRRPRRRPPRRLPTPFPPRRWRRSRGGQGRRAAARPEPNLRRVPDGPSEARAHAHRPDTHGRRRSLDETGRAAGRGAYVCRTGDCLDKAIDQGRPQPGAQDPAPAGRRATRSPGA